MSGSMLQIAKGMYEYATGQENMRKEVSNLSVDERSFQSDQTKPQSVFYEVHHQH